MNYELTSQLVPQLSTGVVIHLAGELDMRVAQEFKEQLFAATPGEITHALIFVDRVTFIDSHNLGSFVAVYQRLKSQRGWIGIVCHQPYLRRVFDVTNLDKLFRFFESWEAFGAALIDEGLVPPGTLFRPDDLQRPASATGA